MLRPLILAAVLAAAAAPAFAQPGATPAAPAAPAPSTPAVPAAGAADPAMARVRQVCAADFAKACPNVKPNTPEATACVRDNFSSLSEPCQGAIMEMMAARGGG